MRSFGASGRTPGTRSLSPCPALICSNLKVVVQPDPVHHGRTIYGASPDTVALCSLAAILSIGVGGKIPVDSAVFLGVCRRQTSLAHPTLAGFPEFIPASHQYLLTVLSIWWPLGQLLGSFVRLLSLPCFSDIDMCAPRSHGRSLPTFHVRRLPRRLRVRAPRTKAGATSFTQWADSCSFSSCSASSPSISTKAPSTS